MVTLMLRSPMEACSMKNQLKLSVLWTLSTCSRPVSQAAHWQLQKSPFLLSHTSVPTLLSGALQPCRADHPHTHMHTHTHTRMHLHRSMRMDQGGVTCSSCSSRSCTHPHKHTHPSTV